MIPFMHDTQSVEGQPRFDDGDVFRVRRDQTREPPRPITVASPNSARIRSTMPSTWAAKP